MNLQLAIVVLATGPRGRLGPLPPALQATLGTGTVLGHTVAHAIQTGWPVVAVTSAALAPLLSPWLATRDLVLLTDDELGRGTSYAIAAGVSTRAAADGWLLLPGNMPLVGPQTLLAVGQALAEHPVSCTQHRGQRGYPMGFASELYSELVSLQGDDGARRLLVRYPARGVDVAAADTLIEVDAADDLAPARADGTA